VREQTALKISTVFCAPSFDLLSDAKQGAKVSLFLSLSLWCLRANRRTYEHTHAVCLCVCIFTCMPPGVAENEALNVVAVFVLSEMQKVLALIAHTALVFKALRGL
jgi:hypothetical protein